MFFKFFFLIFLIFSVCDHFFIFLMCFFFNVCSFIFFFFFSFFHEIFFTERDQGGFCPRQKMKKNDQKHQKSKKLKKS